MRHKLLSNHNPVGYLYSLPWILNFVIFILFPMGMSLFYSFTDFDLLSSPKWIGLDNFVRMFTRDKYYMLAVKTTLHYVVWAVPVRLITALLIATLLSGKHKHVSIYRTAMYIPSIIGNSVAMAITWRYLFGYDGAVNQLLMSLGLLTDKIGWITNPKFAAGTLIILSGWQFGSAMLIFLAGIKNIPGTYYEAAIVDGANPVQRYLHITLPMLSPVILYNVIMGIISAFMIFTQCMLITGGGPMRLTTYYNYYLYQQAFVNFDMGYASAMAWVMLVVIAAITALIFKFSGKWVYYEAEG